MYRVRGVFRGKPGVVFRTFSFGPGRCFKIVVVAVFVKAIQSAIAYEKARSAALDREPAYE